MILLEPSAIALLVEMLAPFALGLLLLVLAARLYRRMVYRITHDGYIGPDGDTYAYLALERPDTPLDYNAGWDDDYWWHRSRFVDEHPIDPLACIDCRNLVALEPTRDLDGSDH